MPSSDLDVQIQGVPKLSGPLLGICSLGRVKRILQHEYKSGVNIFPSICPYMFLI